MQADAEGNLQRYVDHVDFTAAANGESFGRWPNATGKLVPMETRSLGKVNSDPRVGPLVVTEIHYNPHTGVDTEEFLEIANPTHETVPLVNWNLRGGVDFDFPAWATLPAGGIVVLVGFDSDDPYKAADFKDAYDINTPITLLGPWTGGTLENGGQSIRLLRPDNLQEPEGKKSFYPALTEDSVEYDDVAPWPSSADGNGFSLNRKSITFWGLDPASWEAAVPSPGAYPGLGGGDSDSDGMPDDWEQLYFGNADQLATADFDNDGLANLLEYALGSNPANPASANLPSTGIDAGQYLTVTYRKLADAGPLTYTIEVADQLGDWHSGNGTTEILTSVNEGDYNIITLRDKTDINTQSARFIRIVVESP